MTYEELGLEIGKLVTAKQAAYGDSFGRAGEVMRVLYPDGVNLDQIDDALVVVRVLDKLFRIATRKDAFGESPYRDIAGYGLLGAMKDARAHEAPASHPRSYGNQPAEPRVLMEGPPRPTFQEEYLPDDEPF